MNSILALAVVCLYWASSTQAELVDGTTILNDLSKYSKLYVSYNNCAWSPYVADNNNACGANNDNYWYMGLSECFRANVAYSLYGVLQGEEDKGCNKHTFINSFFTTSGVSTFTNYMATAGVAFTEVEEGAAEISSSCEAVQNENNGEQAEGAVENTNYNNVKVNAMSTSSGVGCADRSNQFVMKSYGGAYCDEREVLEVTDTLDTFNKDLSQVNCIAIYDDEAVADEEGNQQNNNGGATALLAYSEPCNVHLYSSQCPDPYGKIGRDAAASAHTMAFNEHPRREVVKTVFSWLLMCFGWVLIGTSGLVYFRKMKALDAQKTSDASKKRSFFGRSRSENGNNEKKSMTENEKKPGLLTRIKAKMSRSSSNV
jgi:hypothetical protein